MSPHMCPPCIRSVQKDPKGTKRSSPHRTAFAALRFPRSGPAPWARRHGPSMAHHGSPGIHAGRPTPQNLLSASREGWQIKNTAPRGGRPAGLFGSRVLRNLCSRCRGTKAAFGVMRHSDEVVAKSGNALCQLNQVLIVYDCCGAVAHQTERSLRSSAAAMYGLAPTVYLLLKNCRPVASMY